MKERDYKQILVLSGKGGTGKTSVSSALSEIIPANIVIDADVDAANLNLILNNKIISENDYFGGKKAFIDATICSKCGLCAEVCRFDAISSQFNESDFHVSAMNCEGCGFCFHVCPTFSSEGNKAISFDFSQSGVFYKSKLENNADFYFARLFPGEGNSGKLVSKLKREALSDLHGKNESYKSMIQDNNTVWVVIDGPPGIGCPVNASLSGVDFVVMVTEPTKSGLHDLGRLIKLLKTFKTKSGLIINKYDINRGITEQITAFAKENEIELLSLLPFDTAFVKAVQNSQSILAYKKQFPLTPSMEVSEGERLNGKNSSTDLNYQTEFENIFNKIKFLI